jgi:hypothetical protein
MANTIKGSAQAISSYRGDITQQPLVIQEAGHPS